MVQTFAVDGIDLRTGTEADHIRDRWTRLEWLDGIGKRLAWAPPWLEDPARELTMALLGIQYDVQKVMVARSVQPIGDRKTDDHVDELLGSLASR
jgi:hypothetical protein